MSNTPDVKNSSNANCSFPKKTKVKSHSINKRKNNVGKAPKLSGVVKPKFKAKNVSQKINTANYTSQKPETDKAPNNKIEESNKKNSTNKDEPLFDTDKLDEMILNEKKIKFNPYKKEDIEEILFKDIPESNKNSNMQLKLTKNKIQKVEKHKQKKSQEYDPEHKSDLENEETKELFHKNKISENKVKKRKTSMSENNSKNKISENKVKKRKTSMSENNSSIDEGKIQKVKQLHIKTLPKIKVNKKKEALKSMLETKSHRNSINVNSNKLRERMLERLKAAQFRYLNEKLYTSSGSDARQLFEEDPGAFQVYHEGYQQQVRRWPVKPLDVIVKRIQRMPKTHTIADMGCGEAELSTRVVQSVRSFDLVAAKPGVENCDMAHTPLLSSSMDVAVYCLALMGTDLTQYLIEANRILKLGGHLLVAEVESRFGDVGSFTSDVQKIGFSLKKIDKSQKVFFFMEFTKVRDTPAKKGKLPALSLKPCVYKKR